MTPQNLMDYVKIYENHISSDLCRSTCEHLSKKSYWEKHSYYKSAVENVSFDNDLSVCWDNFPEMQEIQNKIWFALERYIIKDFSTFQEWFSGWVGYSQVRFNRYDPTTEMRLHCDHIYSIFDGKRKGVPILTILGALNDDYEGGELMMFGDYEIHLPVGSVIIFPSNFMYPHEVKPVKSGVRYSYVSWSF